MDIKPGNVTTCHISIVSNTLYWHKTLELTYTAYNMQQDKDKIRQCKYSGVMVLADDEKHPYLYGQVLDLFHVRVKNNGPHTLLPGGSEAILLMVWVCWFKLDRCQRVIFMVSNFNF